ncbi:sequence-specific DNA binding transcription factor [Wolffia australiana]
MSRSLLQPIGQKRLTNVAVVRLKKHGLRFEIACYKNKVLSWRSGVEKDLDEVLQSQTVYSNVSKGVLAKSKDLIAAFGTDDQSKICLEIMEKGELQVAGKERDSQLSSQFRDIATIIMEKTINPQTNRPYPISMIERFMHEIHFAVDPNQNSKKQALEVIREIQKHFPIRRCPMRLRLVVPEKSASALQEKLDSWGADIKSKEQSEKQLHIACEIEPGAFRECDSFVRSLSGWVEILSISAHAEGETQVDQQEELDEPRPRLAKATTNSIDQLATEIQRQDLSASTRVIDEGRSTTARAAKNRCSTCDATFEDASLYREHFKSEWHKHNLRRKTRQLHPLSAEECLADMDSGDYKADLGNYSF